MKYDLIDLTTFASMPAPWSSEDEGETWVWGDFFGTIQKKPISIAKAARAMGMTSAESSLPMGITYHYAMTIFYNKNRNPHGPSNRPVLSIGIEESQMEGKSLGMPIMVGLFKGSSRSNLGNYNRTLNLDDVRKEFFGIMKSELKLRGKPVKIGTIKDAQGHPQTGWEVMGGDSNDLVKPITKSSGCAGMVILGVMALSAISTGINFLI